MTDPITLEPFTCPFVASDGFTYDLSTLVEWMGRDWKHSSPMTRVPLRPLAFFDAAQALALGLATPRKTCVQLYSGDVVDKSYGEVPVTIIDVAIVLSMAHCVGCEWLAMLMDAKGLMRVPITLKVVLERDEDGVRKPSVVGYPVAANLAERLDSFCKTFALSSMWDHCDRVASCSLFVGEGSRAQYMCTVEELLNDPAAHAAWATRAPRDD